MFVSNVFEIRGEYQTINDTSVADWLNSLQNNGEVVNVWMQYGDGRLIVVAWVKAEAKALLAKKSNDGGK